MEASAEAIAAELLRRASDERIRFFVPHGGQEEFIQMMSKPGGFISISGAGNGWGKSNLMAAIFAAAMWPGLAPDCLAGIANDLQKFPHRARIYSNPAELESIGSLQTAIKQYFPAGRYEAVKGRYSYPSQFHADTGWILDLFSYERDAAEAAGPNIGLQGFNEPPPELLWKEAVARARAGGIIIGGMTSLLDNPWVVSGIFERHNGNDIRVRYGDACENCKTHGKNGNLEHEQIEKILAQYDPDEREARKTGKPLSFSGRILKGFDRSVHVQHRDMPKDCALGFYQAVDPAIGKPMFSVWAWTDPTKAIHVFAEYPDFDFFGAKDSNLTVKEYIDLFLMREAGKGPFTRVMDRHFGNARRTNGGMTLRQEFMAQEKPLNFINSYAVGEVSAEVETGIFKLKDALRYDKTKPVDGLNRPILTIEPECKNTIIACERWSRDPKTGKPQDEFKDPVDCLRYLVMANPEVSTARDWGKPGQIHSGVRS